MNSTANLGFCGLSLALVLNGLSLTATARQQPSVDLKAFTGRWVENPALARGTISKELTYTFSEEPDGFITIVRGRIQLRDRIRFDGKDYPTPDVEGRTTSWTQISATVFETAIKNNGKLTANGKWTLSNDGSRLTQETTRAEPQAATNTIEYIRTSGFGKSVIGTWEPVSSRSSVPDSFVVTLIDATTLSVLFRSGVSYTIRPDGLDYDARSDAFPDMKAVVTGLGPRALRRTTFRGPSPLLEAEWRLSPDGKTLTVTSRTPGSSSEPAVYVFQRED
jgi:hypothetical protein